MLGAAKIVAFVSTRDPAGARAFYGGVLGLRFVSEDAFAVVFDANGTMLRVSIVKDLAPVPHTVLGWEVADIAARVRGLREKGVTFERYPFLAQDDLGIWTAPGGARVAWFKDPDQNLLSLTQF